MNGYIYVQILGVPPHAPSRCPGSRDTAPVDPRVLHPRDTVHVDTRVVPKFRNPLIPKGSHRIKYGMLSRHAHVHTLYTHTVLYVHTVVYCLCVCLSVGFFKLVPLGYTSSPHPPITSGYPKAATDRNIQWQP